LPVYYVLGDHGLCSNPAWATCECRMACIKCPFFVPREPAQLIRSRQTVKHFLEIVQLSDHELAAVQDDEQKLAANIQRTQDLPTTDAPAACEGRHRTRYPTDSAGRRHHHPHL